LKQNKKFWLIKKVVFEGNVKALFRQKSTISLAFQSEFSLDLLGRGRTARLNHIC
jgi:hypothetical protein